MSVWRPKKFYYSPSSVRAVFQGAKNPWDLFKRGVTSQYGVYNQWKKAQLPTVVRPAVSTTKAIVPASKRRVVMSKRVNRSSRTGVGGQLSMQSKKLRLGKKLSPLSKMKKLINANKQLTVYRWNAVLPYSQGRGYYWLLNTASTLGGTFDRDLPFYAFDLTAVNNIRANTTTVISAQPAYRASMLQDGTVDFSHVDNILSTSDIGNTLTTPNLQVEYQSVNTISALPLTKDLLKWANIKMNCYGCKNQAVKYVVQLVRFKDRDILPIPSSTTASTLSSIGNNSKRTNFYQSLLKSYVFNPIATTPNNYTKQMQVLKSTSFIIQDQSTTSGDQDPNSKVLSWFVQLNKMCDYVQQAVNLDNSATYDADPADGIQDAEINFADEADFTFQNGNQVGCYVKPTSRLFLIVYASNYGYDVESNNTNTPSFDLSLRLAHENFN